jgi:hypothetical protein
LCNFASVFDEKHIGVAKRGLMMKDLTNTKSENYADLWGGGIKGLFASFA